jgi:drug/metabolite transporter (DMT)-like permease
MAMHEIEENNTGQGVNADSDSIITADSNIYSEAVGVVSASFFKRFRSWIVLLSLGLVWGMTFSLAKIAAEGGGHPIGIAYWQSLLGAIVLVSFSILKRRPIPINRKYLLFYTLCGILGSAIPNTLFFYAASKISAGVLSITVATVPLMTFAAAAMLRVEKLAWGRALGVIFGMTSIVLLVGPEASLPDPDSGIWVMAGVLAAVCYTIENMLIAIRMPEGVDAFAIAGGMFTAATLIMTPFMFVDGVFVPLLWPWGPIEFSILGMAFVSTFAYGIFVYLIIEAGPVFASQTAYVVTLSGVFWGMIIFGEQHSFWIWISLAIMMIALALVTPRKSKKSIKLGAE